MKCSSEKTEKIKEEKTGKEEKTDKTISTSFVLSQR